LAWGERGADQRKPGGGSARRVVKIGREGGADKWREARRRRARRGLRGWAKGSGLRAGMVGGGGGGRRRA